MSNTRNIAQAEDGHLSNDGKTVRPNLEWPTDLWKQVKKAAIDADMNPGAFVVKTVATAIGYKEAA